METITRLYGELQYELHQEYGKSMKKIEEAFSNGSLNLEESKTINYLKSIGEELVIIKTAIRVNGECVERLRNNLTRREV
jgi:hypothetical protein